MSLKYLMMALEYPTSLSRKLRENLGNLERKELQAEKELWDFLARGD